MPHSAPPIGSNVRVRPTASHLKGAGMIGRVIDRIDKGEDAEKGWAFVLFLRGDRSIEFAEWARGDDLVIVTS